MEKKKIYHIYYNTSGNSGLYLNPIYNSLKIKYKQKLFVNYYYPLDIPEFNKFFFKLTEKNEKNNNRWIFKFSMVRKILRYFELKVDNIRLLRELSADQPDVVNYSLTNMPDILSFLHQIKKYVPKTKIVITCHDVVPFQATSRFDYQEIYNFADYLLVHTHNAIEILQKYYQINKNKILYHPFPIINLSLLKGNRNFMHKYNSIPTFLFLGVMRKEKGVQYLINAWAQLGKQFKAKLVISGFKPDNVNIDFTPVYEFENVKISLKSLSDDEYYETVSNVDYVVFPYTKVGNSGVLSTIVSLNKVPVTTQLPSFVESKYFIKRLSCKPGNVNEMAQLILKIAKEHSQKFSSDCKHIKEKLDEDSCTFTVEVCSAYSIL